MESIYYVLFGIIGIALVIAAKTIFMKDETVIRKKQRILSTSRPKDGVQVDVLAQGQGKSAASGDRVSVHYTAWLTNGRKVDSSYDKGEVFQFQMGRRQVIPGWEAGMLGMKVGEKRKFTIDPDQAYGSKGKANVPPNSVIVFEVELLKMN